MSRKRGAEFLQELIEEWHGAAARLTVTRPGGRWWYHFDLDAPWPETEEKAREAGWEPLEKNLPLSRQRILEKIQEKNPDRIRGLPGSLFRIAIRPPKPEKPEKPEKPAPPPKPARLVMGDPATDAWIEYLRYPGRYRKKEKEDGEDGEYSLQANEGTGGEGGRGDSGFQPGN